MSLTSLPNNFTSYQLSEEEFAEGLKFTTIQLAVLQNLLSVAATKKVNLVLPPEGNITRYAQEEGALQGEITILQYLISAQS